MTAKKKSKPKSKSRSPGKSKRSRPKSKKTTKTKKKAETPNSRSSSKSSDPTFKLILADPNWKYGSFGQKGHGAAKDHYPESTQADLVKIPVQKWSRRDTILALWGTCPKPEEAIEVIQSWGYTVITSVPWIKTAPTQAELAKGIGFWVRGVAEMLYFCRQRKGGTGKGPVYEKMADKPDGLLVGPKESCVFYSRRSVHSRKPLSLIEWFENHFPGPYLELWATSKRPGWECWGHETGFHLDSSGVKPLSDVVRAPQSASRVQLVEKSAGEQGELF